MRWSACCAYACRGFGLRAVLAGRACLTVCPADGLASMLAHASIPLLPVCAIVLVSLTWLVWSVGGSVRSASSW